MEGTLTFISFIIFVFGLLQLILFFKLWAMTNNVQSIKEKLKESPKQQDSIITEAQIKTLSGEKEAAFELYQKAFYLSIVSLYNETVATYGNEDDKYTQRDEFYVGRYTTIAAYYSKRIVKLGYADYRTDKFDTYQKVNALICKL